MIGTVTPFVSSSRGAIIAAPARRRPSSPRQAPAAWRMFPTALGRSHTDLRWPRLRPRSRSAPRAAGWGGDETHADPQRAVSRPIFTPPIIVRPGDLLEIGSANTSFSQSVDMSISGYTLTLADFGL